MPLNVHQHAEIIGWQAYVYRLSRRRQGFESSWGRQENSSVYMKMRVIFSLWGKFAPRYAPQV